MNKLRVEATKLRDEGYSYKMIKDQLGVSVSTQSNWFSYRPFMPNTEVINRIKAGPMQSGKLKHEARMKDTVESFKQAKFELGLLSKRDIWMIGLGLYMGEGSKSIESVRIVNSDPGIIRFAMKWFRESCNLTDGNFSLSMNLYPDSDEDKAKTYWAKITQLPISSFKKTQVDIRTNKNNAFAGKLPYGTVQIRVKANGDNTKGVALFRRIKGWSIAAFNQV